MIDYNVDGESLEYQLLMPWIGKNVYEKEKRW